MEKIKTYDNGLRLVVKTMPGLYTVSLGVLVNTGSINETAENNEPHSLLESSQSAGRSSARGGRRTPRSLKKICAKGAIHRWQTWNFR